MKPAFISQFILGVVILGCSSSTSLFGQIEISYSGKTEWNESTSTLFFRTSGNMPLDKDKFFWNVPSTVKGIVIDENVTVTGGFRVLYRKEEDVLHIEGRNRKTSIIYGTDEEAWTDKNQVSENDKWKYSGISVIQDATVTISNLTVQNPRGYLISGYANQAIIHVESCSLLDTRSGDTNNSDGFTGSKGSSVKNCLISTADDGIKIYNDITIENVIIEHHRNGAPLQLGWDGESKKAKALIKNLKILGVDPEDRYNMAPLTWEAGHDSAREIDVTDFEVDIKGLLYDEDNSEWRPLSLLEIKPIDCHFTLKVKNAKLNGLPIGTSNSKGTIEISEEAE